MPLYEYECAKGHRFEAIQKDAEKPLKKCALCSAAARLESGSLKPSMDMLHRLAKVLKVKAGAIGMKLIPMVTNTTPWRSTNISS